MNKKARLLSILLIAAAALILSMIFIYYQSAEVPAGEQTDLKAEDHFATDINEVTSPPRAPAQEDHTPTPPPAQSTSPTAADVVVRSPQTLEIKPIPLFGDQLAEKWQEWSWSVTADRDNQEQVQSGKKSIAVTFNDGWAGFYLHHAAGLFTAGYTHLEFFIHGGSAGGQQIEVLANMNSSMRYSVTPEANTWTKVSIPLAELGASASLTDLIFQESTGSTQATFYIDEMSLVSRIPGSGAALPYASFMTVYEDQLSGLWQDWSWNTERAMDHDSIVQEGKAAMAVTYTQGHAGLYLHSDVGLKTRGYTHLRFWIHGGDKGGQQVKVVVNQSGDGYVATAKANTWTQVDVPLTQLTSSRLINDIFWQEAAGEAQPTLYLDRIQLVGLDAPKIPTPTVMGPILTATPVSPVNALALEVDVARDQHPISPYIYGINFANDALAKDLGITVNRYGGNATTRYNWKNDVSNRASDWYFENIPGEADPAALPDGSASDQFVEKSRQAGMESIITVPMIGWTPNDVPYSCAFSISKYGAQQHTDPWRSDCGNGLTQNGDPMRGNDPQDTSTAVGPEFVEEWLRHLISKFGTAADGGVKFYNLDNEPMLWNATHRDVHPDPVSYDELRDRTYQYAAAVKAVDPQAQTLGPVLWGWTAYFYSAKDAMGGDSWWKLPLDRMAHGNLPLIEWYLQQMKAYEESNGLRILDYMDLHYYPQASGVALSGAGDVETQARRLRSTRSLWDPSYKDESWIDEPVRLIPRMKEWAQENYPGTKLAITEYNWGALDHINGALAQADVLGIFGREGLDLATLWAALEGDQPWAYAFRMYRNYDGHGRQFGETSVHASSAAQEKLSIYAAKRADGALTLMIINKTGEAQIGTVALANFQVGGQAEVYRYSDEELNAIVRQPDQGVSDSGFAASFPANSITLVVIPGK